MMVTITYNISDRSYCRYFKLGDYGNYFTFEMAMEELHYFVLFLNY